MNEIKLYKIVPLIATIIVWFMGVTMLNGQRLTGLNSNGQALTLDQVIKIALKESVQSQTAELTVRKQTLANRGQWAALFPSINANTNYSYALKKQRIFFGETPMMPGMEDGIEVGRTHSIQAGIQASMPLINMQLWQSLSISREQVQGALIKSQNSQLALITEVKKAFFTVLLAEQTLEVMNQSYDNAQANYKQVEKMQQQGLTAEYDLLQAEVQLNNLRPTLIQAQTGVDLSRKQLLVLIGREPNATIELNGQLEDLMQQAQMNNVVKQKFIAEQSPMLNELLHQRSIIDQATKVKQWAFLPTANLAFNYNYNFMGNTFNLSRPHAWVPVSMITLNLSFPIFSGTRKLNELKEARADKLIYELQVKESKRKVQLQDEQLRTLMSQALEKLYAATKAARSADKGYTIALKRYDVGLGTQLEINNAMLSVMNAHLSKAQAIHEYLTTNANLQQLLGINNYQKN